MDVTPVDVVEVVQRGSVLLQVDDELAPRQIQQLVHHVVLQRLDKVVHRLARDLHGVPLAAQLLQTDVDILHGPGGQPQLQQKRKDEAVVVHDVVGQDQIQRPADAVAQRETIEGFDRVGSHARPDLFDVEAEVWSVGFVGAHGIKRALQDEVHGRNVDQLMQTGNAAEVRSEARNQRLAERAVVQEQELAQRFEVFHQFLFFDQEGHQRPVRQLTLRPHRQQEAALDEERQWEAVDLTEIGSRLSQPAARFLQPVERSATEAELGSIGRDGRRRWGAPLHGPTQRFVDRWRCVAFLGRVCDRFLAPAELDAHDFGSDLLQRRNVAFRTGPAPPARLAHRSDVVLGEHVAVRCRVPRKSRHIPAVHWGGGGITLVKKLALEHRKADATRFHNISEETFKNLAMKKNSGHPVYLDTLFQKTNKRNVGYRLGQ